MNHCTDAVPKLDKGFAVMVALPAIPSDTTPNTYASFSAAQQAMVMSMGVWKEYPKKEVAS